jgi:hypothetical protein
MKHLKKFKTYEAIILPEQIKDNSKINSLGDLARYGEKNGFDVFSYDDFLLELSEVDKKTAPNRGGVPFFAFYNRSRNKPAFVYDRGIEMAIRHMPNFKEVLDDIMSHERIHQEQSKRVTKEVVYNLPDPKKMDEYFSNKEEIMAFSFTIAKDIYNNSRSLEESLKKLKEERFPPQMSGRIFNGIKKWTSEKVVNRYKKYIYLYLKELYKETEE